MSDSMSGSLVFKLEPLAPAAAVLAVNDVVLAIEEVPIADDGTIEFRDEERVDFAFQVRSKHIGARFAPAPAHTRTRTVSGHGSDRRQETLLWAASQYSAVNFLTGNADIIISGR